MGKQIKTPEEIKRGLELCFGDIDCTGCPYEEECFDDDTPYCVVMGDALTYTQQLEQDNAQKDECIRQLERERDQALHDMRNIYGSICLVCKNFYRPDKTVLKFACKEFGELRNHGSTVFCGKFEWRGVEVAIADRVTHWMPLPEPPDNEKEGQLNDRDG